MKKLFLIIFTVLSLSATSSYAQPHLAVRMGYNLSNVLEFADIVGVNAEEGSWKSGFNIGATSDFDITQKISIRTGLLFTSKGYSIEWYNRVNYNFNYIEVPILGVLKKSLGEHISLEFQAGPYLALGCCGKYKVKDFNTDSQEYQTNKYKVFSKYEDKRFDWGFNLGIGLNISHFYIGSGYDAGFISIHRQQQHHCLTANIGYIF